MKPMTVNDADVAFGDSTKLIPKMSEIPQEFHSYDNPFAKIAERLFFSGGNIQAWKAKDGIDRTAALRHFRSILGSFEPSHEHKISACGWLLSEWFEPESLGIKVVDKNKIDYTPKKVKK